MTIVYTAKGPTGRGLFAAKRILTGQRILEFTGPWLTFAEAVGLGEDERYTIQVGPDAYIDPSPPGRFTNHSCDPNAAVRCLAGASLYAVSDIEKGGEITFDYSTTMDEQHWTMECNCGSAACRGVIGDFRDLAPDLQAHYLERGWVADFIALEAKP
jgi:hypothetical protein